MSHSERAAHFRRLHERGAAILILPNAWDAMSARLVEAAGAPAIATTSAGVAWALGRPDGEGLTRDEMVAAVRRIVDVVRIPVTADVERGYGTGTPDDAAETVRAIVAAGAVGVNLEDAPGREGQALFTVAQQAERISAARAAASRAELFINARVDLYLRQIGSDSERFEETLRRAEAYAAAGADGIFVPGVSDVPTIRRLAEAIALPLNVMAGPHSPETPVLAELGVRRVSVGPAICLAAMSTIRRATVEVLAKGSYELLRDGLPYPEANGLFASNADSQARPSAATKPAT